MLDQARPVNELDLAPTKRERRLKIAHEYILSMKINWVKSPNKERKIVRFLSQYPSYFRHLRATWLTNGELHWTYTELITFDSIGVHILTHNQLRLQETSPSTYPLTKCPFDVTSRTWVSAFPSVTRHSLNRYLYTRWELMEFPRSRKISFMGDTVLWGTIPPLFPPIYAKTTMLQSDREEASWKWRGDIWVRRETEFSGHTWGEKHDLIDLTSQAWGHPCGHSVRVSLTCGWRGSVIGGKKKGNGNKKEKKK